MTLAARSPWRNSRAYRTACLGSAETAREQARLAFEKIQTQAEADIAAARFAYEDAAKRWQSYREGYHRDAS